MARYDLLVFIYTLDCPLKCDYCCHPTEELGTGKLSESKAVSLIKEASSINTIKRIVFSGGEPFLYYDEIKSILRKTYETGLPFRIVTSAYWAADRDRAIALLEPLSIQGLDELSITTDPSHQKYVSVEKVRIAVDAALSLGIKVEIASTFWEPKSDIRKSLMLPENDMVSYIQGLVAPTGRAKSRNISWRDYGLEMPPSALNGCRRGDGDGFDLTVYPDGSVYACCSGGFNMDAGLLFGNVYEEDLRTIANRISEDEYVRVMLAGGTQLIWAVAKLKFPDIYKLLPSDDNLSAMCQLCVSIKNNSSLLEKLKPVISYCAKVVERVSRIRENGHEEYNTRLEART